MRFMPPLLRAAAVLCFVSCVVFALCGFALIWLQKDNTDGFLGRGAASSLLLALVSGFYIAVQDALKRIQANSNPPLSVPYNAPDA